MGGSPQRIQAQTPPPLRPRPPYTPRCVCDTIFPQAMVAGPGSKPSACRYIQRCAFSKEVTQAKLIFAVGSVTAKAKRTGLNDSEGPQAPSLGATSGRGGSCIATACSCLARSHFTANGPKSLMEMEPLMVIQDTCLKPGQTKTPALPAKRFARAASLPGEERLPGTTISPAMQCALLSVHSCHA